MTVYFISGLGADERVFRKLTLPKSWKVAHLRWPVVAENETMESYAEKFAALIDKTEPFSIAGLSFGGIIAAELTKLLSPYKTILISSIASKNEIPFSLNLVRQTHLNNLVPATLLNRIYPFTYWYFGSKTADEKQLVREVIHHTSPGFLRWAINEILNWKNKLRPPGIFHIHGSVDRIFPLKYTRPDYVVEGGGHFMVYSHAEEVSRVIAETIGE